MGTNKYVCLRNEWKKLINKYGRKVIWDTLVKIYSNYSFIPESIYLHFEISCLIFCYFILGVYLEISFCCRISTSSNILSTIFYQTFYQFHLEPICCLDMLNWEGHCSSSKKLFWIPFWQINKLRNHLTLLFVCFGE